MATQRTITVTLPEQQYDALAGAVALSEVSVWDDPESVRRYQTLERAWEKISAAWWARARSRKA